MAHKPTFGIPLGDLKPHSRRSIFGDSYTHRELDEFLEPADDVVWIEQNPYLAESKDDLLSKLKKEVKWRYHHDIPALRETTAFYTAYADRVDALLEALDVALNQAGVEVQNSTFLDIAAAEGYVGNHLQALGAESVDSLELNELNLKRMLMIRAYKNLNPGRLGRLDLERVAWSRCLDRKYDVTLALGIVYHLENPMLFLRNLRDITKGAAIIESDTPVFPSNKRFRDFGVVYLHRDQVTLQPGSVRHFTEMRPDRQALIEMTLAAGFDVVTEIPPATRSAYRMYDSGEKSVLLAQV